MYKHLQYVGSKNIHTHGHTLDHALMHKVKCMCTHLNEYHTHAWVCTPLYMHTHTHTHPWESSWHPQSVTAKTQRTSSSSQEGRDSTLSSAEFVLIKSGNDRLPAMTDIFFFHFSIFHSWGYLVSLVGGMEKEVYPGGQIWIVLNQPSWDWGASLNG